jgi:acetamidase/formamidase
MAFRIVSRSGSESQYWSDGMAGMHTLRASPETVHWGYFDASLAPVLTVASGDTVSISAVSGGPTETPSRERLLPEHAAIQDQVTPELGAHIMTGPVAVEGAEPGDLLEVRIKQLRLPCDWGWNAVKPLRGALPDDFPLSQIMTIDLDRVAGVAQLPFGPRVPLAPFFGVMGVAPPPEYGRVSSIEPREYGGNIDLKELVVGSTLFLPVFNSGGIQLGRAFLRRRRPRGTG